MAPSSPPRRPRPAPSTRTTVSYARLTAPSPPPVRHALPATPGRGSYAAALAKATGRVNEHKHPTRPTAADASASAVVVAAPPRAPHGDAAAAALRRLAASLAAAQPRTVVVAENVPPEAPSRTPEVMYDVVAAAAPPRRAHVPALDLAPGPRRAAPGEGTAAASAHRRVSADDGDPLFPGAHTAARAAARRSSSASGAPTPRLVLHKPLPPVTAWRPPSGTPTRKEAPAPAPAERRRPTPPRPKTSLPRAAPALLAAARAAVDDAVIDVATPVTPAWAGVRAPDGRLATAADVPFDVPERPKRRWWFGKKK